MFLSIRILTVILLLSAIYIEQNVKNKNQSNIIFTILLCWYTLHNIFYIVIYLYSDLELLYVSYGAPFETAYSPLIYFYYKASNSELSIRQIIPHSILPAFWGLLYLPFLIDEQFRELVGNIYYIMLYAYIAISWFGYSFYLLTKWKHTISNRINIMPIAIYYILFSIFVFIQIIIDLDDEMQKELSRILVSVFTLGACIILFNQSLKHFKNYTLIEKNWSMFASTSDSNRKKYNNQASKGLNHHVKKENSLEDFFNSSYILKPELDIKDAAKVMNITQKYLSDLIKQNYRTTFFKMLTEKRIEMACRLILNDSLKKESETLYVYCGFKSKATFYRNFLYFKGCTPSQYKNKHSVNN